jgi:tetratricopeptide (TPR) repeat protein
MTFRELKQVYRKVVDQIGKKHIKDALDTIKELSGKCRNTDLKTQLDSHAETYVNILKYSFELGDDPEKEKVYFRLIRSLLGLLDDISDDIIRSNRLLQYYDYFSVPEPEAERLTGELLKFAEQIVLQHETGEQKSIAESPFFKRSFSQFFTILLLTDKLNESQISLLGKINNPDGIPWYDKSLIISALTLSLLRHFDTSKINLLFDYFETGEHQVWQRSLAGLVIAFSSYDYRIEYYPELINRLVATQGLHDTNKTIENIILQYAKTKDTEKITRRIQDEILPEMIKMKSRLEEKLDLDSLLSSMNPEDKNPEWESFFRESPDIYNKLEEFTNLQMEGADVFLGAFTMLKGFDFFRQIQNWFLPFYKENEHISPLIGENGTGELLEGIERSSFLCNSDKYSFCLNLKQMSSMQKSSVMEFFNAELKAMNEMSTDEEMLNSEVRNKVVITQYFQDLYRFFRLHPLHDEFEDIFNMSTELYNTRFFKLWVNNIDTLRNIGEFFFEKGHYHDALQVFSQVAGQQQNYEMFEKIAYCNQKLNDFNRALEYYHKAELFGKNKVWLMNSIAYCSRKTGDYQKAVAYYKQAEKLEPENPEIQMLLGQTYMEMEDYSEALKYYYRIEYTQPDNFKVFRPIAWCSFMLDKFKTALKYLSRSMENSGNRHDFMNMGHIQWCLGNKKEAIDNYGKSLGISGMDFDLFSKTFMEDSRYLIAKGIHDFDIALMLDYIKLTASR